MQRHTREDSDSRNLSFMKTLAGNGFDYMYPEYGPNINCYRKQLHYKCGMCATSYKKND